MIFRTHFVNGGGMSQELRLSSETFRNSLADVEAIMNYCSTDFAMRIRYRDRFYAYKIRRNKWLYDVCVAFAKHVAMSSDYYSSLRRHLARANDVFRQYVGRRRGR